MSCLILLRHAQASFGSDKYDCLSAKGIAQAKATGQYFRSREISFAEVLVGPKVRHLGTAQYVLSELGDAIVPREVSELDEFAEGSDILRQSIDETDTSNHNAPDAANRERLRRYFGVIASWAAGRLALPGVASLSDFRATTRRWLRDYVATAQRGHRTLAVTSAGVIASLVCEVLDLPNHRFIDVLQVANCGKTELLHSSRRTTLSTYNCNAHLSPDLLSDM